MRVYEEGSFTYKEYECRIFFTDCGFRCGYVRVLKDHPLYSKNIDYIDRFVKCHGGISYVGKSLNNIKYKDSIWIGFDCAHWNDAVDINSIEKYFSDSIPKVIIDAYKVTGSVGAIRSKEYVEKELKNIVDQLVYIKETELSR